MSFSYASNFFEISTTLIQNQPIREAMLALIADQPIVGKATEGGNRLENFRTILKNLTTGAIDIPHAIQRIKSELPSCTSVHSNNNRVFANGWAERLVYVQFSRFYNQAVLEQLASKGISQCLVPHSDFEKADSQCSIKLAGNTHSVRNLLDLLIASYGLGQFSKEPKIPDHPHCSHVVKPL